LNHPGGRLVRSTSTEATFFVMAGDPQRNFMRMVRIRAFLNKVSNGAIGHYSTAEHYSTGPTAKVLEYFQYDAEHPITCPSCGWSGTGAAGHRGIYDELFDISCPACSTMLLVVGYPTLDQIRAAAGAGNAEAIVWLERIES
jgi:hypothetical protein